MANGPRRVRGRIVVGAILRTGERGLARGKVRSRLYTLSVCG